MLLSIKPQYAEMIIKGTQKYEFRTRKGRDDIKKIIFYATAPKSQVVGEAEIECVLVGKPTEIWKKTRCGSGIPVSFFKEYYKNSEVAVAYKLTNVRAYETPKALKDYGVTHVPQSFIYLKQQNDWQLLHFRFPKTSIRNIIKQEIDRINAKNGNAAQSNL